MAGNDDGCDLSCATGENHPPEQKNKVYDENRTSFDGQLICGLCVRTCALTFLLVFALSAAGHVERNALWCQRGVGIFSRSSVPCSDSHLCSLLSSPRSQIKAFEPLKEKPPRYVDLLPRRKSVQVAVLRGVWCLAASAVHPLLLL